MLWFCLSNADVLSDGTERFFQYLGGEAIYMPLSRYEKLCAKLKSLGRAVVVEVALSPPELSVFSDVPFAIVSLSRARCRMNPRSVQTKPPRATCDEESALLQILEVALCRSRPSPHDGETASPKICSARA